MNTSSVPPSLLGVCLSPLTSLSGHTEYILVLPHPPLPYTPPCLFMLVLMANRHALSPPLLSTLFPVPHSSALLGSSRKRALHGLALPLPGLVTLGKVSWPLCASVPTSDKQA